MNFLPGYLAELACLCGACSQLQSSFVMRKAALLYNPDSGGSARKRLNEIDSALAVLRGAQVEAELIASESPSQAGDAARKAIEDGCDTVFACGGDGTIHNIVQVMAKSSAALAILPLGTANALAHDLGLPLNASEAAQAAVHGLPRRVALGLIEYLDFDAKPASRYFIVAAGIGVDAHLIYKLHSGTKQRMGMIAYYAVAWNLWFTYAMTWFQAEYEQSGSKNSRNVNATEFQAADVTELARVTELMSVRIGNFGGVVQELAPGASLYRNDMRLVICRTSSRMAYLAYVTRGLLRQKWKIPGIDLVDSTRVSCRYCVPSGKNQSKIYVEADGELLGTLPAQITIVPDALTLLAPAR